MFKLLILVSLLVVVKPEGIIDSLVGQWLPGAVYPDSENKPPCVWYDLNSNKDVHCTCGGNAVPVLDINFSGNSKKGTFAVSIVNGSGAELENALNLQCMCNDERKNNLVFRRISENYIVFYGKVKGQKEQPPSAMLMMKEKPKLSELRSVMESIDDLKTRESRIVCELKY